MSVDAQRVLYGALLLALVPVLYLLIRRGWRRRRLAGEALGLPEPSAPAGPGGEHEVLAEAVYVSTTLSGRPFERVVVHGLGARSGAGVGVVDGAVVVRRDAARSLLVPGGSVVGAQRRRGQVGKFVAGRGGLVVMTWRLGDVEVDTALHLRDPRDAEELVAAVGALAPGGGPSGTTGGAPDDGGRHDDAGDAR